jgi:hypothetical protein
MNQDSRPAAWTEAHNDLADEISRWIAAAIRRNAPIPFQGGHDECNYAAGWPQFSALSGDEEPMQFCRKLRDQLIAWPEFYHGFYPDAKWDIEHSVENWTVFMTRLAEADPGDDVTADCIEHLAHHLGNWAEGAPDWFDWDRRRFVSEWVGTREVRDQPPHDFSTYWDARASELALTMYDLRGDDRYLEFAAAFAGGWADHILAQEGLGYWLMLDADTGDREGFRQQYGEYPEDFHARNIGWIWECMNHMLHVHERVGGANLARASRKVIELAPGYRAGAKQRYQQATGDTRYGENVKAEDEQAIAGVQAALDQPLPEIVMLEGLAPYPSRLYAYRDESGGLHELQGPGPREMMAAYALSGDDDLAVRAMQLAARQLHLAAATLRDGREHGCNGRFLHAAGNEAGEVFAAAMA